MAPGIVVVGLGPGNPEQVTIEAWRTISTATEVYLRTRQHPIVATLPQSVRYHSFDDYYEAQVTLVDIYEQIAQAVLVLAKRPEGVIYAVPGHPLVGETSAVRALELTRAAGLPARVVTGVSILEPIFGALGLDPLDGLQVCDATLLAQKRHPNLDPDVGALITQVYNRHLAGEVKMTLNNLYPDEHRIKLVRNAGTDSQQVRELPLYTLDRQEQLDHLSSIYIPSLPLPGSLASFQDVVARLRAPGGCPWDREQTHQTLRTYLLEEAYEVLAALDADDMVELKEELGDLLLQIMLHAQIATEDGDFRLADSAQFAIAKLIRRHPHVFGQTKVGSAEDVLRNWEQIKREEKAGSFVSMLSGISAALPALAQAMEMQRRAARVGFDWPSPDPVAEKVVEELGEFRQATGAEDRAAELGDLLFSLVNLARWYDIDAESALRQANQRFARRFAAIERHASRAGLSLDKMTIAEMDALWEQAKREES